MPAKNISMKYFHATLFIFFLFFFLTLPTAAQITAGSPDLTGSRDAFTVHEEPIKKMATGLDQGKYGVVVDSETISQSLRAEKGQINLKIEFASGSARLTEIANKQIMEIAGALQSNTLIREKITITGHTDSIGSADTNLTLSRQRALAVKKALESLGVDKSRLSARGRGESEPLTDNQSVAGRARNRRVTLSRQ